MEMHFDNKHNQPLISVIIPVYKVEPYLRKCVDSVLAQTYTNLEIILVDDGSPDNCPAICDEYAEKDSRIKVIHEENNGVSIARNCGMAEEKGDYFTFVDSDDWLSPNHIQSLVDYASDDTIVTCNFELVNNDEKIIGEFVHNQEVEAIHDDTFGRVWNKLYPKRIAKKYYFQDVIFTEDLCFNLQLFLCGFRFVFSDKTTYYYRQRENSIMSTSITLYRMNQFKSSAKCVQDTLAMGLPLKLSKPEIDQEYFRIVGNYVCNFLVILVSDRLYTMRERNNIAKSAIDCIDFSGIKWSYAEHSLLKLLLIAHYLNCPALFLLIYRIRTIGNKKHE